MLKARLNIKDTDLFRISSLQVLAEEILTRKISGECAEVGVYRGKFAKYINALFKDRLLYLFDTFSGFDERDLKEEDLKSLPSQIHFDKFKDVEVEMVLKAMPYPEKCIVKKGYFPETAKDVQESWCLVSIDCDLYKPIYEALKYFYPNLRSGGYIIIHDFNSKHYQGARLAVTQFCLENAIPYIPLSDPNGSVIITK